MRCYVWKTSLEPGVDGSFGAGKGNASTTWDGGEAGPLESEPVMFEFPLYFEGMVVESDEDIPEDRGAKDKSGIQEQMPSLRDDAQTASVSEVRLPHDNSEGSSLKQSPVLYSFDQDEAEEDFVVLDRNHEFASRKDDSHVSAIYLTSQSTSSRAYDPPRTIFDRYLEQQRLAYSSGLSLACNSNDRDGSSSK